MKFGPLVQEHVYLPVPAQRQMVREAARLGCTAYAFNPYEPFAMGLTPFRGGDVTRPKDRYLRRLSTEAEKIRQHGMEVVVYGPGMGPALRRGGWPELRYRGIAIPEADWRGVTGYAPSAFRCLWDVIHEAIGDCTVVDGTEPFFGPFRAAPPLNRYQELMAEIAPGCYNYVDQTGEGEGVPAGMIETHVNPGDPDRCGFGGGILGTDGWGRCGFAWDTGEFRRPYAGLPPVAPHLRRLPGERPADYHARVQRQARRQVKAYFRALFRDAAAMQRQVFLVLHTTTWPMASLNGPQDLTPILRLDAEPFGSIYKALAHTDDPPAAVDEINPDDILFEDVAGVGRWPATSTVASAAIDHEHQKTTVRHSMGGRWPVKGETEGNAWIVRMVSGRWVASTYEWLRPGRSVCDIDVADFGLRAGMEIGLFVSTHARVGQRTIDERSNIVRVTVQ